MKKNNSARARDYMLKLLDIYMDNKKPIIAEINMLNMHIKMTFDVEDLNKKNNGTDNSI